MKMPALLLSFALTACSSGILDTSERAQIRHIAGTEAQGQVDTASVGSKSDAANAGGASNGVDNGNSNGRNSADGQASQSRNPNDVDGGAKAGGTAMTPEQERAAAIAKACPGVDPKVIEQLIASGQPFEVECETEIEVGPDNDND
jgi:hypothetical protein